jgi:hypothetical protein
VTASRRPSTGIVADVRGALALRTWALAALAGRADAACPDASSAAWSLFLEGERCGLPLVRLLESGRGLTGISRERIGQLRMRAEAERARIKSAQRHLRALAVIGHRHGWPVVVFKAAAAALDPIRAVDMEDVDVLVHPDHVHAVAAELKRAGYSDAGGGASARHISGMSDGDLLKIDVHFTLDFDGGRLDRSVWNGTRPCSEHAGLWTLAPADHVQLMLSHVVVEHPNRRSNIRELLLLASQLADSPETLCDVEQRIASHPERDALVAVLREAGALHRGEPVSHASHRDAAATYAVRHLLHRYELPTVLMQWSYRTSFAILLGSAARRGFWQRLLVRQGRSQHKWLARLEDRYPLPGMAVRLAGRLAGALASLVVALPVSVLAILARRHAMSEH